MKLTYSSDLLKTINDLTIINQGVAIVKEPDSENIEIRKCDKDKVVYYHLIAPSKYFSIPESVSFNDYPKFYNKFSMFDNPDLEYEKPFMVCKSGSSKATHNTASTTVVVPDFKRLRLPSVDRKFKLTPEMIKSFRDLSSPGYFDSNRLTLEFKEKDIFRCHSTKNKNKFEDELPDVEKTTDKEFSVRLNSKAFSLLPSATYSVKVSEGGLLELEMERTDDISVRLYLSRVIEPPQPGGNADGEQ